jgi:hypothetical protein
MRSRIGALACVLIAASFLFGAAKAQTRTKALLLFGGRDHKTFLGCVNCAKTSPLSLCNEYGKFGSSYQVDSIWNEYGRFGSEFQVSSPWNEFTTEAPIVVDENGVSYGYFTLNEFHRDRTREAWLLRVLTYYKETKDVSKTRDFMCGE